MKNLLIGILIVLAVVVAAAIGIFLLRQPQYDNFRIAGVGFRKIHPYKDTTGRHYLLIDFYTERSSSRFYNPKDSVEAGHDGIGEPIRSFTVLDSLGKDVTAKLHGWDIDDNTVVYYNLGNSTDFVYYLSAPDVATMVKRINRKEWNSTGSRINRSRLFYTDSTINPRRIIVKFSTYEIRNTLEEVR